SAVSVSGKDNEYMLTEMQPASDAANWTLEITGLKRLRMCGNFEIHHCRYYIEETENEAYELKEITGNPLFGASESKVIIKNTLTNKPASVQVSKVFTGLPEGTLPTNFQIKASWEGQEEIILTTGTIPTVEGLDIGMTGEGTEDAPYIWTITGLPVDTVVNFEESGWEVAGYNWSCKITANGNEPADGTKGTAAASDEESLPATAKVDFVNAYNAGVALPATGGSGTLIYTLGGLALILLAGVLLVSRRRGKA
ncbi:MAG: LPXTG cell wall anchor domain-containing protein, partial [Clostridia bacterium]|nr:LPXTG cell wall anchor domain-containing protein [Clostridia bacterium]